MINLKRGDILLRETKNSKGVSHTAVVLSNGSNVQPCPPVEDEPIPENPAPENPAPENPAPEDPVPEEPIPEEPVPGEPIPEEPVPVEDEYPVITLDEVGTLGYGNSHNITGTVNSETVLTCVKGEFLQGETVVQTYTVTPNATELNLKKSAINSNLKFGKLSAGDYTLKITAVNAAGTAEVSVDFTVTSNLKITVDSIGNVTYGKAHNIKGKATSDAKITVVTGEFLQGDTVKQSVTVKPNAKTLKLEDSNINKKLKFGQLEKGTYILRITAVDAAGETKVSEQTFKIV